MAGDIWPGWYTVEWTKLVNESKVGWTRVQHPISSNIVRSSPSPIEKYEKEFDRHGWHNYQGLD